MESDGELKRHAERDAADRLAVLVERFKQGQLNAHDMLRDVTTELVNLMLELRRLELLSEWEKTGNP